MRLECLNQSKKQDKRASLAIDDEGRHPSKQASDVAPRRTTAADAGMGPQHVQAYEVLHLALQPAVALGAGPPQPAQVRVLVKHVQQPAVRVALQALQAIPRDAGPAIAGQLVLYDQKQAAKPYNK